jgi:hypothetical protein
MAFQLISLSLLSAVAQAQDEARISELSYLDRQYMTEQRELVADLSARTFGRSVNGQVDNDIELLQGLLDRRVVRADMTRELQAMGIVLGDLLAQELDMHWVVYEDRLGRSRALRYRQSGEYLFPVTMISRRQEAGSDTPVADIYQKAYDIIAPLRPPLPFQ